MRLRLHFALFLLLAVLLPSTRATAQATATAPHLQVELLVPPAQLYPGLQFTAGLHFRLEPGWHVYWINAGDSGEPPSIQWNLPPGITASALEFPAPTRLPLGPLMDYGYENNIVFPIPMRVAAQFQPQKPTATLGAKVAWLVCREVCIPGKASLGVTRPALAAPPSSPTQDTAAQQLIAQFQNKLPKPLPASDQARFETTAKGFTLQVALGQSTKGAQFFPLDQTIVANAAPQPVQRLQSGVELSLIKDENLQSAPKALNGILELADGTAYRIHAAPGSLGGATNPAIVAGSVITLLRIAAFAFLGGVILNLMPCVFPVLFIKGLALVQSSQRERRRMRAHGWVYVLGILVSFWAVVTVLLVLRAAGMQLGWGFQFQSPTFLALMAMLLFFLGLSLAGQFEIGLSLTSTGGKLAEQHGYAGSFFTGVLAMIVATPCTAPFMGAAIGYALAHSARTSFAIFTALALGLGAPYLLLAYNPGWTRLLPRPGAWMEVLKQATSIPIFATVIWLVWLYTQTAGANTLAGLLAAFLLLAIAGWTLGRWTGKRTAASIATIIVLLAVALAAFTTRTFASERGAGTAQASAAQNSDWKPFSPELVRKYREQGHPVFVDFTASWCLSCQVNERVVLRRADVQRQFHRDGVVLVRADWTRHDETIARELQKLGRSGVPAYALYTPDSDAPPQLLPEVLTPGIVLNALNALPAKQPSSSTPGARSSTTGQSTTSRPPMCRT